MIRSKRNSLSLTALTVVLLLSSWDVDAEESEHDHEEHGGKEIVQFAPQTRHEFGIEVGEAAPGKLAEYARLPGEVVIDPDRLVHVVPRISGVAQQVQKKLGDMVKAGDVLAVLESRELAEVKSAYLIARERVRLAETTYDREEKLWRETIS